uniref:Aminotransferase class V domain-containing protein n=2 Tax=Oryza brachyantha TaxID=4533 RepID=J3NEL7_ORYBR
MYPDYATTSDVDRLRLEHYSHLDAPGAGRVCLDYCGFGLFDSGWDSSSSSFTLSELNANLSNHALYGGAEAGTAENDIKERILEYLNVPASEYALVFTVSRGSAFRLLAECYPFETNRRLLTMFDHESQSVSWMAQSARAKGAKTRSAWFRWPTLKLCTTELRKEIVGKKRGRRRDAAVGLFVFPAQSRVTGAKYSYQWMALAQQNGWHVMLDAGALGPKDMDSLGLSLFRPDFIITSFYRVFGADPTGFGCLLIKKSVIGSLQGRNGCNASGMVKIVPVFPQYLSDSVDGFDAMDDLEDDSGVHKDEKSASDARNGSQLPAFSGVYTSAQVREAFESDPGRDSSSDRDGASTIFEETESISVGEVMRSPAFSEDCSSENSFWVDVGQSPLGSEKGGQFKKGKLGSPLPSSWFAGRKSNKRMSPNLTSRISRSPLYDGQVVSFDAAVLSVSHDADCLKEDPEEEIFENGQRNHFRQVSEIQEEPEVEEVACQHALNGDVDHKESAIRRETEGEFRLLGGRDGNSRFAGGRLFGVDEIDGALSMGRRVSFSTEANIIVDRLHRASDAAEASGYAFRDDDGCVSDGYDDAQDWGRREPEIICRHIDHVDMMGLNRTTLRLRYLINWLVTSLLQLRLPDSKDGDADHLVHIYGPKIKYERGAAVAFNVKQSNGTFVNAEVVQKIAEKNGISLGIGFLSHIKLDLNHKQLNGAFDIPEASFYKNGRRDSKNVTVRVEVVTASLGFLTNFEDVYNMWAFVAKFLDPSFLESERFTIAADHSEGQT